MLQVHFGILLQNPKFIAMSLLHLMPLVLLWHCYDPKKVWKRNMQLVQF